MTPLGWILGFIAVSIALSVLRALVRAPLDVHHAIKNKSLPELIAGLKDFSPSWVYVSPRRALNGLAIDFGRRAICLIVNTHGEADLRVCSSRHLRSFDVNLVERCTLKFDDEPPYHLFLSVDTWIQSRVTLGLIEALMRAALEDAGEDSLADMRSKPLEAIDNVALRHLLAKGPLPGEFLVATHLKESRRPSHSCVLTDKNLYVAVPGAQGARTVPLEEISKLQTLTEEHLTCPVRIHLMLGGVIDLHDDTAWDLSFIQLFLVVWQSKRSTAGLGSPIKPSATFTPAPLRLTAAVVEVETRDDDESVARLFQVVRSSGELLSSDASHDGAESGHVRFILELGETAVDETVELLRREFPSCSITRKSRELPSE